MATRIVGVTVETQRVEIRAFARFSDVECVDDPTDCCEDPVGDTIATPCCEDNAPASLNMVATGPIGDEGAECEFEIVLTVDRANPVAWSGQQDTECASLFAKVWCVVVDAVTYWTIAGEWRSPNGELHRFEQALELDGQFLVADIETDDGTLAIVIDWPCGTGETVVTSCGVIPVDAYAHITNGSGCACLVGTYPVRWNGSAYALVTPTTVCGGPLNIGVACGSGTWVGSVGCATGGTPTAPTSTSTSPFSLTWTGLTPGVTCCTGTINLVIDTTP